MLALALLVFCTRYLARPEDWSEGLVRFSFWATNIGLMLMILGICSRWESCSSATW